MAKSQTAIVKATKNTLAVSEEKEKTAMLVEYLLRFAEIEGRQREITDTLRDTYREMIINHKPPFSLRQVEKGLQTAMETLNKWPWPSDLIEIIEEEV